MLLCQHEPGFQLFTPVTLMVRDSFLSENYDSTFKSIIIPLVKYIFSHIQLIFEFNYRFWKSSTSWVSIRYSLYQLNKLTQIIPILIFWNSSGCRLQIEEPFIKKIESFEIYPQILFYLIFARKQSNIRILKNWRYLPNYDHNKKGFLFRFLSFNFFK